MFDHGIVSAMDPLRKAIGTLEHLYDELIVVYREVQELMRMLLRSMCDRMISWRSKVGLWLLCNKTLRRTR